MNEIRLLAYLYLDQLVRRRWTAVIAAWVVCVLGWVAVAAMPDRYRSEARFHVNTSSLLTPLLKGISANSDDQSRDQHVLIMQQTLLSRPNLLKVAQMTDLDKVPRSNAAFQDLLTSLESRISISRQGMNLFLVQFTDNSPVIARDVIRALITIFVESSVGDKRSDIESAQTFIDSQIAEYEAQLKAAEQRVADFKVQNLQYLSSSTQSFAMRMENAQDSLKAARFEYEDAASQRARLRQQLSRTPQYLSLNAAPQIVIGGGLGGSLQQRIMLLHGRLDELRLQFTENHPDVLATQRSLTRLIEQQRENESRQESGEQDFDGTYSQVPNELHNQLSLRLAEADGRVDTARHKLSDAQAEFDGLKTRATEAPKIEAEFTNLTRDYEVYRSNYDSLLKRRESARIAAAADTTAEPIQFRMVAAPELPAQPSGPPRPLFNSLVLLFGLLAAVGFVILLAKTNERVVIPENFMEFPEVRLLGSVSDTSAAPFKVSLDKLFNKFSYAVTALGVAYMVVLFVNPNFSVLFNAIM